MVVYFICHSIKKVCTKSQNIPAEKGITRIFSPQTNPLKRNWRRSANNVPGFALKIIGPIKWLWSTFSNTVPFQRISLHRQRDPALSITVKQLSRIIVVCRKSPFSSLSNEGCNIYRRPCSTVSFGWNRVALKHEDSTVHPFIPQGPPAARPFRYRAERFTSNTAVLAKRGLRKNLYRSIMRSLWFYSQTVAAVNIPRFRATGITFLLGTPRGNATGFKLKFARKKRFCTTP